MPVWPFGRRGGRASKSKEALSTYGIEGTARVSPYTLDPTDDAPRRAGSRRSRRLRKRASDSSASTRDAEKSSKEFGKRRYSPPDSSNEDVTALPYSKRLEVSPHLRPVTGEHGPYNFQTTSHSSLAKERGKLQRPQSLRNKRTAQEPALGRRKSSKKRKNDHVREEEIRAMSMPLPPMRPSGYYAHYGDMLRRESKKTKGGLNRHFDRPTSTISLPLEESIHSSMSSGSESREYRVSALDMFSPRPKIRYSVGSQYYYTATDRSPLQPTRNNSSKKERKLTLDFDEKEKENETGNRKKSRRIDDLADSLDAGALREILERDKRRRERKRKAEEERLRRKLERRAEKQRASERPGTPPVAPTENTGVVGLGLDQDVLTPMEDVQHSGPSQPEKLEPTTPVQQEYEVTALPTPLESPLEEPVVADAQAVRYSRASLSSAALGHARASSNISHMPELPSEIAARRVHDEGATQEDPRTSGALHPVESVETSETVSQKEGGRRRSSEGRRMRMWAAIFRRGRRTSAEQPRDAPSEVSFSNTSRESMSRQPPPAHLVANPPVFVRRASAVPARTRSKFREDLPEYPMSPPDSRIQSPEAGAPSEIAARRGSRPLSNIRVESESPLGDGSTADNETRPSIRTDSPVSPGVAPTGLMSQSLASIDSEGSWLSGKPMQRRSNKSHVRSSFGSSPTPTKQIEDFNASYEELGIPDDEYFRKLTPHVDNRRTSAQSGDVFTRKASSTAIAAMSTTAESEDDESPSPEDTKTVPEVEEEPSPEEKGEQLVKDSVERHPTIVHRQPRVKSTEALVSFFTAGDEPAIEEADAEHEESPTTPTSETEPVTLQRAMSVDFGSKHVRHLSAGSAKLLEIPAKRSSVDQRRSSSTSPLNNSTPQ